jgi:archaeosine-15-forming tRNA-guanine transglycosylase
MILTPLGLVPWGLEDLNPWAHIEGPDWLWKRRPDMMWIKEELERLGIFERRILCLDISDSEGLHQKAFDLLEIEESERDEEMLKRCQIFDKLVVLNNINPDDAEDIIENASFIMSKTGRIKNVIHADGRHLFSHRLAEGGISLTIDGAKWAHSLRKDPIPDGFGEEGILNTCAKGIAWVVVDDDAAPFIRQGRTVMHGFILGCDGWTRPDETVLIVDKKGDLLGFGRSQSTVSEMEHFRKGIAVKTREGLPL